MEQYSIKKSTLTALGDAIREKTGIYTKEAVVPYEPVREAFDEATEGLDNFEYDGVWYDKKISFPEVQGATSYKLVYSYKKGKTNDFITLYFRDGDGISKGSYQFTEGDNIEVIYNRPVVDFALTIQVICNLYGVSRTNNTSYLDLTIYPLDAAGEVITTQTIEVDNTMTPAVMIESIESIAPAPPEEAFNITGQCNYRFANGGWDWFINSYGDKVTTQQITMASNMFYGSTVERIPFELDFKTQNNNSLTFLSLCAGMKNLKEVPTIVCNPKLKVPTSKSGFVDINKMFDDCNSMREFPAGFYDAFVEDGYWEAKEGLKADGESYGFDNCYSLRSVPPNTYKAFKNAGTSYYNSGYYYLHNNNYALDEIVNLPVESISVYTSNAFNNTVYNCHRLSRFTFETNEDGTPKTANWKNQTITMGATVTGCIGYAYNATNRNSILRYNSGITADKEVKDDASYQALKNDADWFSTTESYSRYDKTSALETISTLPDVSAGSGNTIKFRGVAGAKTDGGAINTMTDAEIAVAAAKGWTVSFV